MFVALSKGADLFVHMYDDYRTYRAPLDGRLNAMFRDRDFHSRLRGFTLDGGVGIFPYIFPSDTPRPSRLVSLSITPLMVKTSRTTFKVQTPPGSPTTELLVRSSSESLRQLSISGCTIDFDELLVVHQLTHLSLIDFDSPSLTIKKLLSFLQANPRLEELLLRCGGFRPKVDDGEELPFVLLTRLRKLYVGLFAEDLDLLFEHLRIASEVEEVEVMRGGPDDKPETICSWFNDMVFPRPVQCIEARLSSIFGPVVKYIQKSDSAQHPNLPHHSTLLELRFRPLELSDFLSIQVLQDATRLELFPDNLTTSQYLQIFETASALQELVIWAGPECNSVRALLLSAHDSQEYATSGTCPSSVPLPNLSHLRIIEADLQGVKDDDGSRNEAVVSNLVRQRKLLGLGLQLLELEWCNYVSPDWVEELRSFVPEVFWNGRGGVDGDDSDDDYSPSSSGSEDSESADSSCESLSSDEESSPISELADWPLPGP